MAKRSDFAQKLLDDLRVRKERMAASQSSKSSKPSAGDAYSYSKQAYKGSREMKIHQTNGIKNGSTRHKSSVGNKSLSIGEASKEIVPFGRGRNSQQIGDLSMALAFALGNGGKLRRADLPGNSSMLGFLNQIGGRSMDMGKMERSSINRHKSATSQFPTLSHLHIEEISRGAQRLNQILKACSNGLNFDRYSIEIGKELLKGAMDLEESLRMLVNLQEASEYMIPQSKTRITLLDDDDDDDDETTENNQLARPIFSFDKPSRNSHYIQEAARTDLKQRLMALSYRSEATNFSHDAETLSSSNLISHRRSTRYSPNVKTPAAFTEQKNHSSSSKTKPEKERIPNVIAKLMGLEELPENDDSNNISKKEPKEKIERTVKKKTAEESIVREQKTKDSRTLISPGRRNKQIQSNQVQVTQKMIHGLQAEKNLENQRASYEGTIHDEKPLQKDVEGIKQIQSSNKASMKMDKHQNKIGHFSQSSGSRKDIQEKERKQDSKKFREQKGKEKGETKDLIPKYQLQQMTPQGQNGLEAAAALQGQAEFYLNMLKKEMRYTHKMPSNSQPNSPDHLALQQPQMLQNFESQNTRHHAGEQKSVKQKTEAKRQTGGESRSLRKPIHEYEILPKKYSHTIQDGSPRESIHTVQSMGFPNKKHQGDLVQDKSSPNINVNAQNLMNKILNQSPSPRNLNPEVIKEKDRSTILPDMEEKPVHLPTVQKIKVTKVQKVEAPRKIDELVTRRRGNHHSLEKPPKYHTSTLQEMKQRKQNKFCRSKEEEKVRSNRPRDAEVPILNSNKSVSSKEQSNLLEELHSQAEQAPNLFNTPADGNFQILKGKEILPPNENSSTALNVGRGQKPEFGADKLRSHSIVSDILNWTHEGRIDVSYPSHQEVSILEKLEPLTESENHLKQILIKSQLFLNTAEALFKLNIPLDILRDCGYDCHDEDSKLVLDCGYEVMKRKGKRQELSVHPFMRISISSLKVRSLDDLIKKLHKDFEKLKFYGRNDKAECVVEDYLPKMLEIDVYNRDPDVSCMWEFGWHEMMFIFLEKDDVVRDVERHLLNALLDEATRDLLLIS